MSGFPVSQYHLLRRIHERVLEKFKYKTDEKNYGKMEFWATEKILRPAIEEGKKFVGDCEDFAMVCMAQAREAGLKARLVTCVVETGEGHCICEVVSADGDEAYFFDNRFNYLVQRSKLKKYKFHSAGPWNPEKGDKRPWRLVHNTAD